MTDVPRTMTATRRTTSRLLVLMILAALVSAAVASDERAGSEPGEAAHEEHSSKGLHELSIFVGATDDRGDWAGTWGIDYGYAFMDRYIVGAYFDRAEGQLRSSVVGVSFWAQVVGRLMVIFGPGIEFLEESHEPDEEHLTHGEEGSKRHFLARIGVGYSFHVGKRYTILPVVNADFVDEHVVWVTGVNFGYRFGKKAH